MKFPYYPEEEAHYLYESELDCLVETIYDIAEIVEVNYNTEVPTFPIFVQIKDKLYSECKPWGALYLILEQCIKAPIHAWGPILILRFKKWQNSNR